MSARLAGGQQHLDTLQRLGMRRAAPSCMSPQELGDRSQRFALDIITFCDTLPHDPRTQAIASQLHDAANSVAMNYRAACRARSHAEFVAKICVTVEEADETEGWLETLVKSRKASGEEVQRLLRQSKELLKIFSASKRTALRNSEANGRQRLQSRHRQSPNR